MIQKLRIKFICVIMAIVMLMLGSILGIVVHFTGQSMRLQSINMMRAVASSPFQQGNPGKPSGQVRLPFFTVQISSRGELVAVSGGYFDLSDKDYIRQIVDESLACEEDSGILSAHNLRFLKTVNPMGVTIVFADTTAENTTLRNLVGSSILIFSIASLVFFGISVLLSHWVIKPVATAWDQQRQFVADASHELKTPLSVIMANAELMQQEETIDEDRIKFAKNILSMSYQMRSLVENMLEMARVDNGTLKMQFAPLDFSQLVSDAALSFQLLYEDQGLRLVCSAGEEIRVNGSEQHLYQVLDVLLDNALKYSTPGGQVSVELTATGRVCTLAVSSPGDSLSREELKNIFKRFYRADKARTMNGSYGLGLSIAESIVTAHRGRIWAESRNGHNVFFVQFPYTGS